MHKIWGMKKELNYQNDDVDHFSKLYNHNKLDSHKTIIVRLKARLLSFEQKTWREPNKDLTFHTHKRTLALEQAALSTVF